MRRKLRSTLPTTDNHFMIAFLPYLDGNMDEALAEFATAKRLASDFVKNFEGAIEEEKEFAPILGDLRSWKNCFRKAFLRLWSVAESGKFLESQAALAKVV